MKCWNLWLIASKGATPTIEAVTRNAILISLNQLGRITLSYRSEHHGATLEDIFMLLCLDLDNILRVWFSDVCWVEVKRMSVFGC